jgi:hypothetical protein
MEQECVCKGPPYFEGDQVCVAVCPTITVRYHHSGNFPIAHYICEKGTFRLSNFHGT